MSGDSLIVGLNRVHHRENSLADGTGNNRIMSDNPRGLNGSTQHSAETHRDHRRNRTSHLSGYATYQELTGVIVYLFAAVSVRHIEEGAPHAHTDTARSDPAISGSLGPSASWSKGCRTALPSPDPRRGSVVSPSCADS